MVWVQIGTQTGRPKVGLGGGVAASAAPPPIPGCKPDENAIFPGQSWPEYPNLPNKSHTKTVAGLPAVGPAGQMCTLSCLLSYIVNGASIPRSPLENRIVCHMKTNYATRIEGGIE